jgi:anthranilate synthase/aminodeoxychorismate synthase-like glutamine amidotransferase
VLVIDNYDSFVFNLVQYLGELGADPIVRRNDEIDLAGVEALDPDAILISPGPGTPHDAGISCELIRRWAGRRPILGVCLGHQAIGEVFGGDVVRAEQVMHGKTSPIQHDGDGVFAELPQPFEATRYHSLVVDPATLPDELEVTAWTDPEAGAGKVIMGLRHREHDVEGVQFHPESILTGTGHQILQRFLDRVSPSATPSRSPGLTTRG